MVPHAMMPCLGKALLVGLLAPARSSLRPLHFSFSSSVSTLTKRPPRRAFSNVAHSHKDLFNYTSGRWIINDALRHAERRVLFDIDELCRLAAQSINRSPDDIVEFAKLAEGGFNRTFLITLRGGFQMVARIPYHVTPPKNYAVASEVATMTFLRSSGLPIPKVYGYSPMPDNAAGTEFIFMEHVEGIKLTDIWLDLAEKETISVLHQLVQLESKMMSISFPAGGSLYYVQDLQKIAGMAGVLLEDKRFCVGPDVRLPLWFGKRPLLDVDRGPYERVNAALTRGAHKELAYLEQFGQPLLPFQRVRREGYRYQEQSHLDHIENLNRYLLIAPSLVPKGRVPQQFCIRHPDLQPNNIIVSRSHNSALQVVGLLDWQHASILPSFLLAGIPNSLQNYDDPVSQSMTQPSFPKNLDDLDENAQQQAKELYLSRIVHYHYVNYTEELNKVHYATLLDYMSVLRRRLFEHASNPWEGETLDLKVALIEATDNWEALTGGIVPCPIKFDAEDKREAMELEKVQNGADEMMEACQNIIGTGSEGWVSTERYEEVMVRSKQLKQEVLAAADTSEVRAEIAAHWPFDDMDEDKYL